MPDTPAVKSRKGQKRDPLLSCPNIIAYRDVVHLQLNYIQRRYVAENVSCCERGQRLWRGTLTETMLQGNIYRLKDITYMVKLWSNEFYCEPGRRFTKWEEDQSALAYTRER